MIIGYARVSTIDQSLDLQLDALNEFDCDEIYKVCSFLTFVQI
jgi:DNA invertase Pin-like site-specific DNA recombinase